MRQLTLKVVLNLTNDVNDDDLEEFVGCFRDHLDQGASSSSEEGGGTDSFAHEIVSAKIIPDLSLEDQLTIQFGKLRKHQEDFESELTEGEDKMLCLLEQLIGGSGIEQILYEPDGILLTIDRIIHGVNEEPFDDEDPFPEKWIIEIIETIKEWKEDE